MVVVRDERSINVTLVCIMPACAAPCVKCVSTRLRAPLIAYRVSIVWSPMNVFDVISPSNSPPPGAEDDEDDVEFGVDPPHEAPNVAVRMSARERTAWGELVRDLNRIIEYPFLAHGGLGSEASARVRRPLRLPVISELGP